MTTKLSAIKFVVEKNILGTECMVSHVHLRTDKIKVMNHRFRKPVSLKYARHVVCRLTHRHTVFNVMLENYAGKFWSL